MDINFFKTTRILDGGMGQELLARGMKPNGTLWSANALLKEEYHQLLLDTHLDFIKAGADAITINSYGITPHRLKRHNLDNMFVTLQQKSVAAAKQAIDEMSSSKKIQIYGCLPPLIGSYYRTVGINRTEAVEIYKKMIQIQERGVDAFICETVTSIEEAQILIEATSETSKKVILSFTVDEVDGTILRSGESLELALNEFDNSKVDVIADGPLLEGNIDKHTYYPESITHGAYTRKYSFTYSAGHAVGAGANMRELPIYYFVLKSKTQDNT